MYLHVKIWVDVMLLHQLFDLFTPLHELPDLLWQDSHFQAGIWDIRNLLRLAYL